MNDPTPTLTDEQREAIATELEGHMSERDFEQGCTLFCGYDGDDRSGHFADALAPLIARMVADAEARALREAARDLPGFDGIRTHGDAAAWLRDRADRIGGDDDA